MEREKVKQGTTLCRTIDKTSRLACTLPRDHNGDHRANGLAWADSAATPFPSITVIEGKKDDAGKAPWELFMWRAANAVVHVLEYGARKYAPNNWRNVPHARQRYFAATMRHLVAWYGDENIDPESGLPHLAHAACSLLFILELESDG